MKRAHHTAAFLASLNLRCSKIVDRLSMQRLQKHGLFNTRNFTLTRIGHKFGSVHSKPMIYRQLLTMVNSECDISQLLRVTHQVHCFLFFFNKNITTYSQMQNAIKILTANELITHFRRRTESTGELLSLIFKIDEKS